MSFGSAVVSDRDYDDTGVGVGGSGSCSIYDLYTRTDPDGWGSATSGQTWSVARNAAPSPSTVEVTGTTGRVLVPHPTTLDTIADDTTLTMDATAFTWTSLVITGRFRLNSQDLTIVDTIPFIHFSIGSIDWNLEMGATGRRLQIVALGASPNHVDLTSYVLSSAVWYRFRFENDFGNYLRLRIWAETDAEPSTWDLDMDATGQTLSVRNLAILHEHGGSSVTQLGQDLDVEWDDLQVCRDVYLFDDFNRTLVDPVEAQYLITWGSGQTDTSRYRFMARRDRSVEILDEVSAVTLLPWQTYWLTNGFGTVPVRPTVSDSPITYTVSGFFNDPDPPLGWQDTAPHGVHFDWEARTAMAFARRGQSYPANLTECGFFAADQVSGPIHVYRNANLVGLKATTLEIVVGSIPLGIDFDYSTGSVAASPTIPIGSQELAGDISWVPPDGAPDFMLRLAGDSDNGSGQNWIHVQDTVADFSLTSPPQTLLARYPNERYSFNLEWDDILGHHHTGWGSNDAYENAGIYSGTTSTPRYTLKYQMAPGWGVGVVNWNLVDAQGDDWSDIATVEGGYGILRVHPSPISGVAAYAWTSTDDRIYAPFEYAFTIRMASPVPSHSPYQYGFYVGCLSLVNLWPGDDVVGGAGGTVTLPLDWTQDVGVHVKVDSTGTYIRVWQASDPEPSAWTLSNTSAGWQWTDAVDYIWPSFTLQPADDDLTSENALYVGSPTPPGGGTAISSPDWDVTATGWGS